MGTYFFGLDPELKRKRKTVRITLGLFAAVWQVDGYGA